MRRTRKWIRLAVIGGVLAALAVAAVLRFSIEPADYTATLAKQVEQAQALLDGAVQGNGAGQYSAAALGRLRAAIEAARALTDKEAAATAQQAALASLKAAADRFPGEANTDCLTAEELARYREQKTTFHKTVALTGGRLTWAIEGRGIAEPAPVNLAVAVPGGHGERIATLLAENGLRGQVLSFAHEGRLPGRADITLEWGTPLAAAALYRYQPETDSLRYVGEVTSAAGTVRFSIAEGGDWVLCAPAGNHTGTAAGTTATAATRPAGPAGTTGPVSTTRAAATAAGERTTRAPVPVLTGAATRPPVTAAKQTVTLTIRCDTILANQPLLNAAYAAYVPPDGVILAEADVELYAGESVFDVLKRVTRDRKIALVYHSGTAYGGAYIDSIGHLDDRAVKGDEGGWMYRVNGVVPNYGCGQYTLKDGDRVEWLYTCNLGQDVGDPYYE